MTMVFGGFRKRRKTINDRTMNILDLAIITDKKYMEKAMSWLSKKQFKIHQGIINELSMEENTLIPVKHKIGVHNWLAKEETETIYDDYIESMKDQLYSKYKQ